MIHQLLIGAALGLFLLDMMERKGDYDGEGWKGTLIAFLLVWWILA